jgi:hypothetical protein
MLSAGKFQMSPIDFWNRKSPFKFNGQHTSQNCYQNQNDVNDLLHGAFPAYLRPAGGLKGLPTND